MSNSRWSNWSQGTNKPRMSFGMFIEDVDTDPKASGAINTNPTGPGSNETPAQKARRLGLISDGHGAYTDPQTGEIKARTVNGELVFMDANGATTDGENGLDTQGPTTSPTIRDESGMVVVPSAQPKTPEDAANVPSTIPAQPPSGFTKFINGKRSRNELEARMAAGYDRNIGASQVPGSDRDKVDAARKDGLQTQDAHELVHGEVDPTDKESLAKLSATHGRVERNGGGNNITADPDGESLLSKGRQLAKAKDNAEQQDDDQPLDLSNPDTYSKAVADYDSEMKKSLETLRTVDQRKANALEKRYEKFRESLGSIPSAAARDSYVQAMAFAKTFEGRINSGAGKNDLGYVDIQSLNANRDRLIEGYGDGKPETIKKFVESVRSSSVSDDFVDASWEILPEKFKKSLSGKGQVTGDKYVSDDRAHKDMHFNGWDENGEAIRGSASGKDRAKLMWKIYLQQGGRDAYTGLPLKLDAMDLEHVRGFNNKDGGAPGKEEWEQRENDNNFTLINSNINQTKVDLSMKDYFERAVDPLKDKPESEFGQKEALFDKQNEITSVGEELARTLKHSSGAGFIDELDVDTLSGYFDQDDNSINELKTQYTKVGMKAPSGLTSKMGKTVLKAIGLSRGITDKSGRRTQSLNENIYRGFLKSMASADTKDRKKYMDGWKDAIKLGNEARHPSAVTKSLVENGLINQDILDDKKAGRVFREDYLHPGYESFIELVENYGDAKYHPDKLSKDLPKGYKYGNEQSGKGDHKTRSMQVDGKDTDIKIGGASKGTKGSYSPSWADGHRKAKKTLSGIDRVVGQIRGKKKTNDTAKRMEDAVNRATTAKGKKVLGDMTGGRKQNIQGKGNKAQRRIDGMS